MDDQKRQQQIDLMGGGASQQDQVKPVRVIKDGGQRRRRGNTKPAKETQIGKPQNLTGTLQNRTECNKQWGKNMLDTLFKTEILILTSYF